MLDDLARYARSPLLNGLTTRGFVLLHFGEETSDEPNPGPGTWQHYLAVTVLYLHLWATYQPTFMTRQHKL